MSALHPPLNEKAAIQSIPRALTRSTHHATASFSFDHKLLIILLPIKERVILQEQVFFFRGREGTSHRNGQPSIIVRFRFVIPRGTPTRMLAFSDRRLGMKASVTAFDVSEEALVRSIVHSESCG